MNVLGVARRAAALVVLVLAAGAAHADGYSVLYHFRGGLDHGEYFGTLARDSDGNIYGVSKDNEHSQLYRIAPDGKETVLRRYSTAEMSLKTYLIVHKGALYAAAYGNAAPDGAIVRIALDGAMTVLHKFDHSIAPTVAGSEPEGPLIFDDAGIMYGITREHAELGGGAVWKLSPAGEISRLHAFDPFGEGGAPWPVGFGRTPSGDLIGTTSRGHDPGAVYRLTPGGRLTVLNKLVGKDDSCSYPSGVAAGADGSVFVLIGYGGGRRQGAICRIAPDRSPSILYSFTSRRELASQGYFLTSQDFDSTIDGLDPVGLTIFGSTLFGMTRLGGEDRPACDDAVGRHQGCGLVFAISPDGAGRVLHRFTGGPDDGGAPEGVLMADEAGNLYGTTPTGGAHGAGVMFKITP